MKNIRYILTLFALCTIVANAQENKGFNALDYSMQKRWKGTDEPFVNKGLLDNTSISIMGGYSKLFPQGKYKYKPGMSLGFAVSKQVDRRNQFRLGFVYKSYIDQSNEDVKSTTYNARYNQKMTNLSVNLDHLFNLSAYFWGYKPNRRFEVSSVLGLGYTLSKEKYANNNLKNYVFDAHAGVQLKMRTNSPIDITVEPRVMMVNDAIDFSSNANWNRFDYAAGAMLGLTYNFSSNKRLTKEGKEVNMTDGLWFDISTGLVAQTAYKYEFASGKVLTNSYGTFATMSPIASIGVGKWLMPGVGLRLSAESYSVLWHGISFDGYHNNPSNYDVVNYRTIYYNHTRYESTTYTGAGLEFVLAPQHWFIKEKSKIEADIMIGGKIGHMDKKNYVKAVNQDIANNFRGLTAALRLKAELAPGMNLFFEPRYNINYYDVTNSASRPMARESHSDSQYAALFGVEISNSATESKKKDKTDFKPHFFASLGGGMNISLQDVRYSNLNVMDIAYSGAVGYNFSKLSSVRVNVENKQVAREVILDNSQQYNVNKYAMLSTGVDYMFNIANFVAGYDENRKIGFQLYGGPNINLHSKDMKYEVPYVDKDGETLYEEFTEEAKKTSVGYEFGGILSYRITPHIDINLNVKYHKYDGDVIDKNIEAETDAFETKYRYVVTGATKVDRAVVYQLGVTYNF